MTTVRRHVRHVHSSWPAPYTGVIATILFAIVVVGGAILLLLRV